MADVVKAAGIGRLGPDGTVYPNHHLYFDGRPEERVACTLLWGENAPKHADASITFADRADAMEVTLGMVFSSHAELREGGTQGGRTSVSGHSASSSGSSR